MNCIQYAINEVKNSIPYEVLYSAMTIDEDEYLYNLTSLEEKITHKVLKKRVLLTANIIGGIETVIPIGQLQPTISEAMYTVYNIPGTLTMDKEIVSALSLAYLPTYGFTAVGGGVAGAAMIYNPANPTNYTNNSLVNVANRIGSSVSNGGIVSNAHLEIVGRNTIAVYSHFKALGNYGIRVVLENHSNLNNIQPRSYKHFATLLVLATKAYIHNKLIIPLNSGLLSGGQELGVFKSIVESYSESEEEYQTYLKEAWGKVAYMNDTTRYYNLLNSMLAPNI